MSLDETTRKSVSAARGAVGLVDSSACASLRPARRSGLVAAVAASSGRSCGIAPPKTSSVARLSTNLTSGMPVDVSTKGPRRPSVGPSVPTVASLTDVWPVRRGPLPQPSIEKTSPATSPTTVKANLLSSEMVSDVLSVLGTARILTVILAWNLGSVYGRYAEMGVREVPLTIGCFILKL